MDASSNATLPYGNRQPRPLYKAIAGSSESPEAWERRLTSFFENQLGTTGRVSRRASSTSPGQFGLFAERPFQKGTTICTEKPWLASQMIRNRHEVISCSSCLRFLGSLEQQLDLLSGRAGPADVGREPAEWQLAWLPEQKSSKGGSSHESARKGSSACSYQQENALLTKCACGETFCSPECLRGLGHDSLCVAKLPDDVAEASALFRFKVHAMQTSELYLFAGKALARLAYDLEQAGNDNICERLVPLVGMVGEHLWNFATPSKEDMPVGGIEVYRRNLQEEITTSYELVLEALHCTRGGDMLKKSGLLNLDFWACLLGSYQMNNFGVIVDSPLKGYMHSLSKELVKGELQRRAPGPAAGSQGEVSASSALAQVMQQGAKIMHKHLVGQEAAPQESNAQDEDTGKTEEQSRDPKRRRLEADAVTLEQPGQSEEATAAAAAVSSASDDTGGCVESILSSAQPTMQDMLEDDNTFCPPLDGIGIFPLMALVNHSCDPNAKMVFQSGEHGLQAKLVALRSIAAGSEIFHSYIDRHLPKVVRIRRLQKVYGFRCRCKRCA